METKSKDLEIKCPKCGQQLINVYKDRKDIVKISCRNCKKWIWYNPQNGKYQVKEIPPRTQASGIRFY